MIKTAYVKLVAFREDFGGYVIYVFEIIDGKSPFEKYIMCTRFPNWESSLIMIGDVGFLKYKEVIAGKDMWYDIQTGNTIPYKYTGIHFIDFVQQKNSEEDNLII